MPAIEVILKKPVASLGAESDIVKVKPGYARNFLFPQNIAIPATAASKRQIEALKKIRAERETQEQSAAEESASKLSKVTVTFQLNTTENDLTDDTRGAKVFGSVTAQDISARLQEMGHEIEKKRVILPHALKELGEHTVEIHLPHGIETKIKVVLASTNAASEEAAKAKARKDKAPRRDGKKSANETEASE